MKLKIKMLFGVPVATGKVLSFESANSDCRIRSLELAPSAVGPGLYVESDCRSRTYMWSRLLSWTELAESTTEPNPNFPRTVEGMTLTSFWDYYHHVLNAILKIRTKVLNSRKYLLFYSEYYDMTTIETLIIISIITCY